jgi:hypothetical protein
MSETLNSAHDIFVSVHDIAASTHQMPCGVVLQRGVRGTLAAAALVKHDDAVGGGVEEAAEAGGGAAARAAVNDDNRFAHRVATLLEIQSVNVGDLEHASFVSVDLWVELQVSRCGLHSSGTAEESMAAI